MIGFPGGFSYGDDVASGRIFAMRARERLYERLRGAVERGTPIVGICNGFQVLVQMGLLPGPGKGEGWPAGGPPAQEVSLAHNERGMFMDEWVGVEPVTGSVCVWTQGLEGEATQTRMLPIAHGEGRLVAASDAVLDRLEQGGQVALRYAANPNGSSRDIAGICDASGCVLGLMPHPERYIQWEHHPFWTRLSGDVRSGEPMGLRMFRNAVDAAKRARV